jgi:hypothetical protein
LSALTLRRFTADLASHTSTRHNCETMSHRSLYQRADTKACPACCSCTTLRTLTTDAAGELHILRHDGHALGVDRAQVGVLEEANQVALCCLLERHHSRRLEAQVSLVVLSDLAHEALEGQLADEQLSGLLVLPDLTAAGDR